FLVEQVNVVGHASLVEELVELLVVDSVRALDLAVQVRRPGPDVHMVNIETRHVPVELRLEPGAVRCPTAGAASMLTAAYYTLANGTTYAEPGADYFDRRSKSQLTRRLIKRLEGLGVTVEIRPAA